MFGVFLFPLCLFLPPFFLPQLLPSGYLIVPGVWCWGQDLSSFPPLALSPLLLVALSGEMVVSGPLALLVGALTVAG